MADALTADPPALAASRPGTIVLARHGEPAISRKVKLSADEYRRFWASYEQLGIRAGQTPPDDLASLAAAASALVASTRLRSIETAEAVACGRAFARDPLFVEAPLPPPHLPGWIRFSPAVWGFLARVWWWFFDHHEGGETRREAQARADQAAALLIDMTAQGDDVVVLAHGFFNYMVGRALSRRGWRLTSNRGYKYWSHRRYERN
ncbi:histidine phosphatase family protein [Phenylobacterium sp.]|uniref:histidine phosphatase family protein n=1 Tax=Phenylobacterium sp. TaxID=1871053 RepID=UPI0035AED370